MTIFLLIFRLFLLYCGATELKGIY